MTTLFLDLSGKCARILLAEGDRCVAVRTIENPSDPSGDIGPLLAHIATLTQHRIGRAHLVIPEREVTASNYKLQEIPFADAEKIIRRRLATVTGEKEPPFLLTVLGACQHQQSYLAEHCSRQRVSRYRQSFAAARIRLKTIATPLPALLAGLTPLRQEMTQPHVVFHIDNDAVTTLILSPTDILHFSRTAIPPDPEETTGAVDPDRLLKRKLFGILTLLHGIYSQYLLDSPRFCPGKVWLCGAEAGISGLPASLADAMNVEVALVDPLSEAVENKPAFTVLAGLLRTHRDPKRGNLLSETVVLPRLQPRIGKLAAGMIFILIATVLMAVTEGRVARLKNELQDTSSALKTLEASAPGAEAFARDLALLRQVKDHRVPFHDIFRHLAEQLPDAVLLDGIRYLKGPDRSTLELVFVTADTPATSKETVFSTLTDVLDRSPHLANYADPVIAMTREGDTRLIQVTVVCTIAPTGGASR